MSTNTNKQYIKKVSMRFQLFEPFIFSLFVLCSLSFIACKNSVEEESAKGEEITEGLSHEVHE